MLTGDQRQTGVAPTKASARQGGGRHPFHHIRALRVLAAALAVALPLTIAADALAQAPGSDQYVPSVPTAKGNKKDTPSSTPSTGQSGGSSQVDQTPTAPSSGPTDAEKAKKKAAAAKRAKLRREAARRKAKRQAAKDRAALAAVPAADSGGNDGDDDGALASVGNALTDWDDPVLPYRGAGGAPDPRRVGDRAHAPPARLPLVGSTTRRWRRQSMPLPQSK